MTSNNKGKDCLKEHYMKKSNELQFYPKTKSTNNFYNIK